MSLSEASHAATSLALSRGRAIRGNLHARYGDLEIFLIAIALTLPLPRDPPRPRRPSQHATKQDPATTDSPTHIMPLHQHNSCRDGFLLRTAPKSIPPIRYLNQTRDLFGVLPGSKPFSDRPRDHPVRAKVSADLKGVNRPNTHLR